MKTLALSCVLLFTCCITSVFAQHNSALYYDVEPNTKSQVSTLVTNYGMWGLNVYNNKAGTFWKRGTTNEYVFGGGFWMGAIKAKTVKSSSTGKDSTVFRKMNFFGFDPNSGQSEAEPLLSYPCSTRKDSIRAARCYFGSDFNADGSPLASTDTIGYDSWPVWKSGPNDLFGTFLADKATRTSANGSALFLSDEDVVSRYDDHQLSNYLNGADISAVQGYPLGLSIEQRNYFFQSGPLQDVIVFRYEITHTGADTLLNCFFAPVIDYDIAPVYSSSFVSDDRWQYYSQDTSLALTLGWSETSKSGESGKGLGYMGLTLLQTPAVGGDKYIVESADPSSEIGVATSRNWVLTNDPTTDIGQYDFMATRVKDTNNAANDKRMIVATGPFHLRPNEKFVVSYALIFASPAAATEANGSTADEANLVSLCQTVRAAYATMRSKGVFADVQSDNADAGVTLRPNPSNGTFSISLSNSDEPAALELYSVLGQQCFHAVVYSGQRVQLSSLADGQYIAVIRQGTMCRTTTLQIQH